MIFYMNAPVLRVFLGYGGTILLQLLASAAFLYYRSTIRYSTEKTHRPLVFHSPDDTPRDFVQYGLKSSGIGSFLLKSWYVNFVVSYIYVVAFFLVSLSPALCKMTFGSWDYNLTAWLFVYTMSHGIAGTLIILEGSLKASFMLPSESIDNGADFLVIEEVKSSSNKPDDDETTGGCVAWYRSMAARLEKAKSTTVLMIQASTTDRFVEFTCVRYFFRNASGAFEPEGIQEFTPAECIAQIKKGGNTLEEAVAQKLVCGKNEINVHVMGIFEALMTEFWTINYMFASMAVWSFNINLCYNIGIFWLLLNGVSGIYRALWVVRPNQMKIRDLAMLSQQCTVLRSGKYLEIDSSEIVLGDVVLAETGSLPVDCLVARGGIVVNECMLTGEPMPIQKVAVETSQGAQTTKKNIAYSGTNCMQVTPCSFAPAEEERSGLVVAFAVGALTMRGQLVRLVLFPTSVSFKCDDELPTLRIVLFLYVAFLTVLHLTPLIDLGSWNATYTISLNTLALAFNPMLTVSLLMGQMASSTRLTENMAIQCLQPSRIPIAGKISTMVFDKTGTITKDDMDFASVLPVDGNGGFSAQVDFIGVQSSNALPENQKIVKEIPGLFRTALGSAHSVSLLDDGTMIGNQVEVSMVSAVGWKVEDWCVSFPDGSEVIDIMKKLEFDHCRMTSGVVVRNSGEAATHVFVKGSYEKIGSLCNPESMPADYAKRTAEYARDGYYVLGVAHKALGEVSKESVADMGRDELEGGLSLVGLILFKNVMKWDSPKAIAELNDGGIRSVICTGDNALTGISIGRQCGIVPKGKGMLLGDISADMSRIEWRCPESDSDEQVDPQLQPYCKYDMAVAQGAWRHLYKNTDQLNRIWGRITVFGRMKPEDKMNLIAYYQTEHTLVVGMCGDGGNDCGALRAAHAGLALSEAEASLVSPFSTARDGKSLMTMVDVIREGRCCIATNMGSFTFWITYAFVFPICRVWLNIHSASNFGEYVWMSGDMFIGVLLAGSATRSVPEEKLGAFRPTASVLGIRTMGAIAFSICLGFMTLVVGELLLWSERHAHWYVRFISIDPDDGIGLKSEHWHLRGDNYDSAVAVYALFVTLGNVAYSSTYGGIFRANVIRNWALNVAYALLLFSLGFCLFAGPTVFHCVFRLNCDNVRSVDAAKLGPLAWFSVAGVGGCFMGPQIKDMQLLMDARAEKDPKLKDELTALARVEDKDLADYRWLPDKADGCAPPSPMKWQDIKWQNGCEGPNNCWSEEYRWEFACVLLVNIIVFHVFFKVILLGEFSARLRRQSEEEKQRQIDDDKSSLVSVQMKAVLLDSP